MPRLSLHARLIAFLFGVCALAAQAAAQEASAVRLIVPYAAGGLPDTVARILAPHLAAGLGAPVSVDNRSGGSGAVALTALLQSRPNEPAFLLTDGPLVAIAPTISPARVFDTVRKLVPVSVVGTAPLWLAVNPSLGVNSLNDMVTLARANPGKLTYGSSGVGSIHHLTAETMAKALGIKLLHVPFRGSSASVPAMIGGTVDMTFASSASILEFARAGRARVLAINSARRSAQLPEVPTIGERIPGFDFSFTVLVFAKPGTPQQEVEKLSHAIQQAVEIPAVAEQLRTAGLEPFGTSASEASWVIRFERSRISGAIQDAGLKR